MAKKQNNFIETCKIYFTECLIFFVGFLSGLQINNQSLEAIIKTINTLSNI
jgi:hypothetical protein